MSLISDFAQVAANRPKQIALITEKSQLTYEDMLALVQLLDIELSSRGVRRGQTLVLDTARAEFCIAFSLLLSLRGLTVIFGTGKRVIEAELDFDRLITLTANDLVAPDKQIVLDPSWFTALGTFPLRDFTAHEEMGGQFVTQSSGSTGTPKFIISTEAERMRNARLSAGFLDVPMAGRRFCSTLSARAGWTITANLGVLLAGGSVLSLDGDRNKLPAYLDLYRVDALVTTPAIMSVLLDLPNAGQYLSSLRDVRVGGATATPSLIEAFGRLSGARLHIGYGAAEIGPIFMRIQDPKLPAPAGFLGQPCRKDVEVAFFTEDLTPLPDANEGVIGIRFKDASMARQYIGGGENSEAGLVGDYFFPGDIMRRTEDGYFYVGRVKNIVNFSGNKFSLEAVAAGLEAELQGTRCLPLVESDERGLERLAIFYTSNREIDASIFEQVLKERFTGLRVSRAVRLTEFPLTGTGKIDREAIKERYGLP